MTAATAASMAERLRQRADPAYAAVLQRFFKTAPGEYGEGDVFIGVRVPQVRALCRACRGAPLDEVLRLLRSRVHEERLLALLLLVDAFGRADPAGARRIHQAYLANLAHVDNWDLVDASAAQIVGAWLETRSRLPLQRLARSPSLWERRIAIIATLHFIRRGELAETLRIADRLLQDPHDLVHKAVGWMLREVGKRDARVLRRYLRTRYRRMPRTMLRYAIERLPPAERRRYLNGTA